MIEQLKFELDRYEVKRGEIETVFIGGGTPSTIDFHMFEDIFFLLSSYLSNSAEITTEANPNSATLHWLSGMKGLGIDRVSFGVQSFDDKKLEYLGRNHSSKVAIEAIQNAHKIGISNLSLDLIHGITSDNKEILKKDLDIAFSLPINHISTYHLSIEKGTLFDKEGIKNKENVQEQRWLYEEIRKRGFKQYEISNFGTYISKHNLGYWQYKNYIGLGAGAVGFYKDRRFYPKKSVDMYIKEPLAFKVEKLKHQDIKTEKIFLGLRSIVGFDSEILNEKEGKKAQILLKEGKIYEKNGKYFNNDYLLSDEITLFILS